MTAFRPAVETSGRNYLQPCIFADTDQRRLSRRIRKLAPITHRIIMVRQLKHHEHKLLRKVDFFKADSKQGSIRQNDVVRRVRFYLFLSIYPINSTTNTENKQYMIQKPEDYTSYNRLCGQLRQLAHRLTLLAPENPYRLATEKKLLDKLYDMAILSERSKLSAVENKVTVSAFARRRLNVILTRLQMAPDLKAATTFIDGVLDRLRN